MAVFDFLRRPTPPKIPDACDLLILVGLVASGKDCAHAFYQKHYAVIDDALALRSGLRPMRSDMAQMMRITAEDSSTLAARLRTLLFQKRPASSVATYLDAAVPTILSRVPKLLADTSCPAMLSQCRWMAESLQWPGISPSDAPTDPAGETPVSADLF